MILFEFDFLSQKGVQLTASILSMYILHCTVYDIIFSLFSMLQRGYSVKQGI